MTPPPTATAPTAPVAPSVPAVAAATAGRAVPTRRISFEESLADLPRHFAADEDLVASHLMAMLSSVFPDGEDYFVRSVRHFRSQVTDPELKRQVAGFIGQESVHGREHRVLNERLAELGYPTRFAAKVADRALRLRERLSTPTGNLAETAALEHVTATVAQAVMSDPELRRLMGHPAIRDVFCWHALEESEHKAVAFDLYRTVGGSERTRILTMKAVRVGFVVGMTFFMCVSLAKDPAAREPGRLRASLRRFRSSPLARPELWAQLKDYDRRDFHPDDHDTDALLELWREELFGDDGRLVGLLVGGAGSADGSGPTGATPAAGAGAGD